ncbi:SusD family protein [Sphingobacterium nematocida]|uniref:SusD family protein n=2 Tax=Sphingobacterium nematocida TaxID=1513896 RepID=A0A1T5DF99_9SPHI|nr:SusD family protein [Sphingobacterium nematocida]
MAIVLTLTGCSKFLDVKPLDSIMEDELFSSIKGFNTAINGVYSELNTPAIYGENLSVGLLDVMAQYYDVSTTAEHQFRYFNTYNYADSEFKKKNEEIWQKMYSLIVNLNAIVLNSDKQETMLGNTYYHLFKGEALAMRAYLHFDLLRLYGSTYSEDKDKKVIPYVIVTDREVQPLLSNSELLNKVIEDLLQAKDLLAKVDPILTEGVLNQEGTQNNYLNYRQYRMNYFAVCGLLARVYLWAGDTVNANKYAVEVISQGQKVDAEIFKFVTSDAVKNRPNYPDRVFSGEVMFALYNSDRVNLYNRLFNYSLNPVAQLTFVGTLDDGRFKVLYPEENDYRHVSHWAKGYANNRDILYFAKFAPVSDNNGISNAYKFMMPLMRISEMYLIAAETATLLTEGTQYFNKVGVHRGSPEQTFQTREELNAAIQNEYLREFIGEGQTYYYFKRLNKVAIPSPVRPGIDVVQMDKVNYIMPLPDSEISQRN